MISICHKIMPFVILLLIVAVCPVAYSQSSTCPGSDSEVYDGRIIQIKGQVTIMNHPTLGTTPGNGMYLVFQRTDCKKCLIATKAGLDGSYEIFAGEGRYKLIVQENRCDYGGTGCDCYDLLMSDQARYIDAKRGPTPTVFDIKIKLPKK
jgi:hypothetical protein